QQQSISYLLREPISVVAKKLEPFGFIRIHRSVLVNSSFVEQIKPYPTGEYGLLVKGGKEYTVTRTYKENLRSLAEFSIGTAGFFLNREPRNRAAPRDFIGAKCTGSGPRERGQDPNAR